MRRIYFHDMTALHKVLRYNLTSMQQVLVSEDRQRNLQQKMKELQMVRRLGCLLLFSLVYFTSPFG
jgi:hypothetical protein